MESILSFKEGNINDVKAAIFVLRDGKLWDFGDALLSIEIVGFYLMRFFKYARCLLVSKEYKSITGYLVLKQKQGIFFFNKYWLVRLSIGTRKTFTKNRKLKKKMHYNTRITHLIYKIPYILMDIGEKQT